MNKKRQPKVPWAVWSGSCVLASEYCGMDQASAEIHAENHRRKGTHDAEARPGRYKHLWGTTITNEQFDREQAIKAAYPYEPKKSTPGEGAGSLTKE